MNEDLEELNNERAIELCAEIDSAPWHTSTSKQYKDAPHQYIIIEECPEIWGRLCALIDAFSTPGWFRFYGRWHEYGYWTYNGKAYWHYNRILNRADAKTIRRDKPT